MKLKALVSASWIFLSVGTGLAQAGTSVFINEVHYDNTGTDTGEAIEIAGPANTDLNSWSIVLYNGNDGKKYATYPLTGSITNSGNGFGFIVVDAPGIQNGAPDGIALVNATGQVVQFLSYEGVLTAVDGPAAGTTSIDIGVAEGTNAAGTSLQLSGSGSEYESFTWAAAAADTFRNINTSQSFNEVTPPSPPPPAPSSCGQAATLISAIQGTTDTSPLVDKTVVIEGIVTASFQAAGQLNGFFVEEETAHRDNDPQTSEGVFVYDKTNTVQIGDLVRFSATVVEYNGLTELKTPTSFTTCATAQALPPLLRRLKECAYTFRPTPMSPITTIWRVMDSFIFRQARASLCQPMSLHPAHRLSPLQRKTNVISCSLMTQATHKIQQLFATLSPMALAPTTHCVSAPRSTISSVSLISHLANIVCNPRNS